MNWQAFCGYIALGLLVGSLVTFAVIWLFTDP